MCKSHVDEVYAFEGEIPLLLADKKTEAENTYEKNKKQKLQVIFMLMKSMFF